MSTPENAADSAPDVLISVNPNAGARSRQPLVVELHKQLLERGLRPTQVHDLDQLTDEATRLLEARRLRAVVAAGGDGTVRLVAERIPPAAPLIVLPLGTENLLARYLELAANPWQLTQTIDQGCVIQMDAGEANGRLFTLMAGCGFDADVVRRLHESRRGHIQHLSYAKPILDAIRTYDYPELRVHYAPVESDAAHSADECTGSVTARWVFVVNLPRYAGGLSFSPQASGTDGLLDVCTFKEGSLWHGLMYLGGVVLGQHEAMQDFGRIQTRRLRIEAAGSVPYQLDGDPGGELPVEIRILPRRLTLLVARPWAVKRGIILE